MFGAEEQEKVVLGFTNMLQNDCQSREGVSPAQSRLDSRLRGNDK